MTWSQVDDLLANIATATINLFILFVLSCPQFSYVSGQPLGVIIHIAPLCILNEFSKSTICSSLKVFFGVLVVEHPVIDDANNIVTKEMCFIYELFMMLCSYEIKILPEFVRSVYR